MLAALPALAQNTFENQFRRPLGDVLTEIGERFQVKLKYDIDTTGQAFDHYTPISKACFFLFKYSISPYLAPLS